MVRAEYEAEGFPSGPNAWNKLKMVYGGTMGTTGTTVHNSNYTYALTSTAAATAGNFFFLYTGSNYAKLRAGGEGLHNVRCIKNQ
ncbi:MAG: hypothetical protein HN443_01075 [Flavobacteriaceae bacterium]|jgi:hypothetical protein|nr:hypothetical protein [Flavobacteriaceae bacterium]